MKGSQAENQSGQMAGNWTVVGTFPLRSACFDPQLFRRSPPLVHWDVVGSSRAVQHQCPVLQSCPKVRSVGEWQLPGSGRENLWQFQVEENSLCMYSWAFVENFWVSLQWRDSWTFKGRLWFTFSKVDEFSGHNWVYFIPATILWQPRQILVITAAYITHFSRNRPL